MHIPHHAILKKISKILMIGFMLMLLTACPNELCEDGLKGMILDYRGLDGCKWLIRLDNGELLEPVNLNRFDLQPADSMKVVLTYTPTPDIMSICMAGKMVRITCISSKSVNDKKFIRHEQKNHNSVLKDQPVKAPAYPGLINYKLPDGYMLKIYLRGDEHQHTALTPDGYYLVKNDRGYYEYATGNASGELVGSGIIARNPGDRTPETIEYLKSIQE